MTKDQIIKELKVQFAALQELQKKNKNVLQYLSADLKLAIKEAKTKLAEHTNDSKLNKDKQPEAVEKELKVFFNELTKLIQAFDKAEDRSSLKKV